MQVAYSRVTSWEKMLVAKAAPRREKLSVAAARRRKSVELPKLYKSLEKALKDQERREKEDLVTYKEAGKEIKTVEGILKRLERVRGENHKLSVIAKKVQIEETKLSASKASLKTASNYKWRIVREVGLYLLGFK